MTTQALLGIQFKRFLVRHIFFGLFGQALVRPKTQPPNDKNSADANRR
jgi:hypothetical protein